ncbi:MAG: DUF721 domain-containing protein [Actinomycetota bacterium]
MSDPLKLGSLLAQLAAKWGMDYPMESARLFAGWQDIVGAEIAAKCQPTALKQGVLKVKTSSPAWASEFKYLAPAVIKRVNEELGHPVVKEIRPWIERSH